MAQVVAHKYRHVKTAAEIPDSEKERFSKYATEMGDIDACPFTRAWAAGIRTHLQLGIKNVKTDAHLLGRWAEQTRDLEIYRLLDNDDGKFFESYEEFCTTPYPWGLGYERTDIETIILERKKLQAAEVARNAVALDGHGGNRVDVINLKLDSPACKGGTSSEYLAARLKRDRPDLLSLVESGQLKSLRAAALIAGILKTEVRAVAEPRAVARAIKKNLTDEQVQELISLLKDEA